MLGDDKPRYHKENINTNKSTREKSARVFKNNECDCNTPKSLNVVSKTRILLHLFHITSGFGPDSFWWG